MKTVAAIYTAISIIEPIKALFSELMPEHRLVNVYDDSLIPDVISAGNSGSVAAAAIMPISAATKPRRYGRV